MISKIKISAMFLSAVISGTLISSDIKSVSYDKNPSSENSYKMVEMSLEKRKSESEEKRESRGKVVIRHNMVLYKGESRVLDFLGLSSEYRPEIKNSDKKVISLKGRKMTAKKCGHSVITINVNTPKNSYVVLLNVNVRKSSFYSSVSYKSYSADRESYAPSFVMHKEMTPGKKYKMKISGYDKVSFTSSSPSVASVNSKGEIKAKKKGTAFIRAKVVKGKSYYTFCTKVHVQKKTSKIKYTNSDVNKFFSKAGFIGSSIGEGQRMYFSSKGAGFLGNPKMLVRGCYSFANDNGVNGSSYQLSWGGYTAPARFVVKKANVKYLFINMGANDLWDSAENVYKKYVNYIQGIKAENPGIVIYVEASTPVFSGGQKGNLNNFNVNKLNRLLKKYCRLKSDIYFIDINSPLKDSQGGLRADFSSDRYVHLTMSAYNVWTQTIVKYVKNQWIAEKKARDAVVTYRESKSLTDKKIAKECVRKLEKSKLKTRLLKSLK